MTLFVVLAILVLASVMMLLVAPLPLASAMALLAVPAVLLGAAIRLLVLCWGYHRFVHYPRY
jgi:hypothetical protein